MNINELLNKAIYIQFPKNSVDKYYEYPKVTKDIHYLPIHDDMMYSNYPNNSHHYTYEYSYKYVLPLLAKICKFKFNINDFTLIENIQTYNNVNYDFSYLLPKHEYKYTVTSFEDNIKINGKNEILMFNDKVNINGYNTGLITEYHKITPFPHSCFKIVNKSIKQKTKILISGDSMILPAITPLTNYFKEVYYYDNRTKPHISFQDSYINENFDYVIIALWANPYNKYIIGNLL